MFKIKIITTGLHYILYMTSNDYNNARALMHNEEYNVPKNEFITFYGKRDFIYDTVLEINRDHLITIEVLDQPK